MLFDSNALTIWILIAAILLGIKHSIDADHIAATSNILFKSQKFSKTVKLSVLWTLGHTATAGLITLILFLVRDIFLSSYLTHFEIIVAIMLIFIGLLTFLWELEIIPRRDTLSHDSTLNPTSVESNLAENTANTSNPSKYKLHKDGKAITLIGIIQGLASNDELLLLLTFTLGLDNLFIILLGCVIFSIGVMIGMITWGSLLKIAQKKYKQLLKTLNIIIASLAIIYGIYILSGGEGINFLELISILR
jgi:ABC-type nickel/cobalt efflux system permease component RcnA